MAVSPDNVLKNGLAWLTGKLVAHASDVVTYSRDADSVDVPAVSGPERLEIDDGMGGIRVEYTDLSFTIAVSLLKFGTVQVTPKRGDLVSRTTTLGEETYEALPFGVEPVFEVLNDSDEPMFRVRTKRIHMGAFYS